MLPIRSYLVTLESRPGCSISLIYPLLILCYLHERPCSEFQAKVLSTFFLLMTLWSFKEIINFNRSVPCSFHLPLLPVVMTLHQTLRTKSHERSHSSGQWCSHAGKQWLNVKSLSAFWKWTLRFVMCTWGLVWGLHHGRYCSGSATNYLEGVFFLSCNSQLKIKYMFVQTMQKDEDFFKCPF